MPYIGNDLATQFQAFATQTITGDGSTGYTLDRAVANGKEILVYINNVKQEEGSGKSYTASGTTITFSEAVASGDSCYLVYMGSAQQTVTAPDGSIVSGQIANANLEMPNSLDMNGKELILDADADTSITADTDDQIDFKVGGTDRMHLVAEKLGIGESAPSSDLVVKQSGSTFSTASQTVALFQRNSATGSGCKVTILSGNNTSGDLNFGDAEDEDIGKISYEHNNNAMTFTTNTSEAMRIDSNGYLFINATSSQDSGMFFVDGTGENANCIIARVNNNLFWNYVGNDVNGTNTFLVYGNGNVQSATNSYGSTSDEKLKENIEDSGSQWDDIKAVKVKKFSLKSDKRSKANMLGVIAQDLEASGMNGLVENNPDRDEDMNDVGTVTKSVKYSILYMKAIKALQEAMARIEILEAEVAKLKG
jgi:hypothetical protein